MTNFFSAKAAAVLKPHRVQPELRNPILMFNMDMGRFIPITGVKEETIGPFPENSRHPSAPESRPFSQKDQLLRWTTNARFEQPAGIV
jgi:hypothetical protein